MFVENKARHESSDATHSHAITMQNQNNNNRYRFTDLLCCFLFFCLCLCTVQNTWYNHKAVCFLGRNKKKEKTCLIFFVLTLSYELYIWSQFFDFFILLCLFIRFFIQLFIQAFHVLHTLTETFEEFKNHTHSTCLDV